MSRRELAHELREPEPVLVAAANEQVAVILEHVFRDTGGIVERSHGIDIRAVQRPVVFAHHIELIHLSNTDEVMTPTFQLPTPKSNQRRSL